MAATARSAPMESAADRAALEPPVGRLGVVALAAAVLLFWSSMYLYVPILPVYARTLGASLTLVGLLVGAYGFSQMVLRVPIGLASDRIGRRKPFVALGLAASGAGALGLGLASTPETLVLWRGVVGIAAATWVASSVLYASYFASTSTARAIGTLSFLSGVGQLVATALGGFLADSLGWQAPFLGGAALAAGGLLLLPFVPERRGAAAAPSIARLARVGFTPSLLLVGTIAGVAQYASWAVTYAFVPLWADALGATRGDLGVLTAASVAPQTAATLVVARLVARSGARWSTIGGLLLMSVSVAVVPWLGSLTLLGVAAAIGGVGRGIATTVLMAESVRSIAATERATAMGVFQAVYAIGMFLGPATAGALGEALGLAGAFWTTGALVALAIPLCLLMVGRNEAGAR